MRLYMCTIKMGGRANLRPSLLHEERMLFKNVMKRNSPGQFQNLLGRVTQCSVCVSIPAGYSKMRHGRKRSLVVGYLIHCDKAKIVLMVMGSQYRQKKKKKNHEIYSLWKSSGEIRWMGFARLTFGDLVIVNSLCLHFGETEGFFHDCYLLNSYLVQC